MIANEESITAAPEGPVKALWICMIIAWILFLLPIPGAGMLAAPVNLAAFVLAIVCIVKGNIGQGIIGLIGTTIGAGITYWLGWLLLLALAATVAMPVR